eukprot:COSAG01_NODE_3852_length_5629_cov_3.080108_3_plen_49_part_00
MLLTRGVSAPLGKTPSMEVDSQDELISGLEGKAASLVNEVRQTVAPLN